MSTHAFTRNFAEGAWDVRTYELSLSLESVFPGKRFVVRASGTVAQVVFEDALTPAEEVLLDAAVTAHKQNTDALARAQRIFLENIDKRTDELIEQGFSFGGHMFSLSVEAQIRVEGMDRLRTDPVCVYPVEWNALDDGASVSLADAAALHNFFLTAVGTLRARVDSGTVLKNQVRAATSLAELNAITDNR